MIMQSTTKCLTTTASALSLGLLLSGSLAMAADAPAAIPSTTPPAQTYPHWTAEEFQQHWGQMQQSARDLWAKVDLTPEQRQQYWEQIQQSARDLWVKWGLTPEQRQQYWEQMQRGWHDLEAMVNPPVATPPTAPAIVAVVPAAIPPTAPAMIEVTPAAIPPTALTPAAAYPPKRIYNIWAIWRMSPEQRQTYWEYMQRGGK